MKRYQVYLDPQSVSVLDEIAEASGLDRSRLIRAAVDRLSQNLGALLPRQVPAKSTSSRRGVQDSSTRGSPGILSFSGLIRPTSRKATTFATQSDRDYFGI